MASDERRSLLDVILASCECGKCSPCAAREELRAIRAEVDTRNITIDHLAAENAAMREALEKIASETAATWVCDTARAALGGRDE